MKKITLFVLYIICNNTFAQIVSLNSANKALNDMKYMDAIAQYQQLLSSKSAEQKKILFPLAFAYKKINDTKNAEKYFGILAKSDTAVISKLYYAQSLSANGKYKDANEWYKKYALKSNNDGRAANFVNGYKNINTFYKDSSNIKVSLLNINSPQSDFSPSLYKKGLVFSSSRKYGKSHRFFGWNNTSFLDLFYIDDTAKIKPATGDLLKVLNSNANEYADKVHTDETRQTSNDSPVLGYLSDNNSTINSKVDTTGIKTFSSAVNSKYHEGPTTFYSSGDSMFFTRNNFKGIAAKKSKEGIVKLKIYTATNSNGVWGNVKEFEYNNKDYSVGHPALSADNKTLYFISDMPGGFGGTDLYSCTWDNNKWSAPKNLGKSINTQGDEMFPHVRENDKVYFASNFHAGLGGLDIFCADLITNKVTNMGYPINTMKDDFGILFTNETNGYLSSNRKRGLADDDIYSFSIAPAIKLKVLVLNESTKEPLQNVKVLLADSISATSDSLGSVEFADLNSAKNYELVANKAKYKEGRKMIPSDEIKAEKDRVLETTMLMALKPELLFEGLVKDKHTNSPVSNAKMMVLNQCTNAIETVLTDSTGNFKCILDPSCDYVIKGVKDSYFPHCIKIAKNQLIENSVNVKTEKPIYLVKIELNATLEIENLYYDLNKADIRTDAALILNHLEHLLEEYDDIKIELGSHTDSRSIAAYNIKLSQQRADSAVAYLKQHGIAKNRIKAKGYGEKQLLNKCKDGVECTEEEHQLNRRTEIKVTGFVHPKTKYPEGTSKVHHHDAPLSSTDDFSDCMEMRLVAR